MSDSLRDALGKFADDAEALGLGRNITVGELRDLLADHPAEPALGVSDEAVQVAQAAWTKAYWTEAEPARTDWMRAALEATLPLLTPQPVDRERIVADFIAQREEYVRVLRQCVNADADYHRWQGHAEARRQLRDKLLAGGGE